MPAIVDETIRSCTKWFVRINQRKDSAARCTDSALACLPKTGAVYWPHAVAVAAKYSAFDAAVYYDVMAYPLPSLAFG